MWEWIVALIIAVPLLLFLGWLANNLSKTRGQTAKLNANNLLKQDSPDFQKLNAAIDRLTKHGKDEESSILIGQLRQLRDKTA